jgi:hypothetical protein
VSEKDGILVEARPLSGQPYKEHRVTAHMALSIEQIDAYFRARYELVKDGRVTRTVVEKTPDRMVYHDRLKMPIGSDRNYTLEFKRSFDAQTKVLEWRFHAIDLPTPPACDGCVKMNDVHGSWTFSPAEGGGSDITYVVYSDPGGDIPKWMVASKQAEAADNRVRMTLKDAQASSK